MRLPYVTSAGQRSHCFLFLFSYLSLFFILWHVQILLGNCRSLILKMNCHFLSRFLLLLVCSIWVYLNINCDFLFCDRLQSHNSQILTWVKKSEILLLIPLFCSFMVFYNIIMIFKKWFTSTIIEKKLNKITTGN